MNIFISYLFLVALVMALTIKIYTTTVGEMYEEETDTETEETSEGGERSITLCNQEAEAGYDCQSY